MSLHIVLKYLDACIVFKLSLGLSSRERAKYNHQNRQDGETTADVGFLRDLGKNH